LEQGNDHGMSSGTATGQRHDVKVDLIAVVAATTDNQPVVLTIENGRALPSGPFELGHRSLQAGLRMWVEQQTGYPLGYMEQLYTFADRDRIADARAQRAQTAGGKLTITAIVLKVVAAALKRFPQFNASVDMTTHEIIYTAIYGLHESHPEVDIVLEKCGRPRVFEWNVLSHANLRISCVDIDGVLCCDPTKQQDDDGLNYLEFLSSATPLNVPRYKINSIVTARLEKYRPQTEAWLEANGVQYDNLFMLDLPSATERRRLKADAEFKSEVYRNLPRFWLISLRSNIMS
jgi:hypothetical protein